MNEIACEEYSWCICKKPKKPQGHSETMNGWAFNFLPVSVNINTCIINITGVVEFQW